MEQSQQNYKKEFDSELTCNQKFLKTKIKSYGDEATDFHDEERTKMGSSYTCLAAILIAFVTKNYENYYAQLYLKECKCIE